MALPPRRISRRSLGKLLLAVPAAATLAAEEKKKPSDLAEFLAAHEPSLSSEERERLKKDIDEGEEGLAVIRKFSVPDGVAPAFRFSPIRSSRR